MRPHTVFAFVVLCIAAALAARSVPTEEERARSALADRDYGRAVALLEALLERDPGHERADYRAMLHARGLLLSGDAGRAAQAGSAFLARYPGSRFRNKVAFLTARALLLDGRGEEAGEIMEQALERLGAKESRAWLLDACIRTADGIYEGKPAAGPFAKGEPPDFARAVRLYGVARELGAKDRGVLLRLAAAALETKGFDLALEVLDELDPERGAADALLLRARALSAMKEPEAAREVVERLVARHPRSDEAPWALYMLETEEDYRRIVEDYPRHGLAPAAAYWRGRALAKDKQADRAVEAFDRVVTLFPGSPEARDASLGAADALSSAGRYEEAHKRYEAYLRAYPESADWAEARDSLIDAWYFEGEQRPGIWEELRARYPLSPYAPQTLLEQAEQAEDAKAVPFLRELLARYDESEEAPTAALLLADILARQPGRMADAVEALRDLVGSYEESEEAGTARRRLEVMQAEALSIVLPAPRAPGEPTTLEVETRNIESVDGRVYRIDPVAYFSKHGSFADLADVMVEVIAPDATFSHRIEGYERFRAMRGELKVPVEGAGAYIVVVEGGDLRASGLLLVSDLTLITKEAPTGVLAFVQAAGTGKPVADALALVQLPEGIVREARTGSDGVARVAFENATGHAHVLAVAGASVAYSGHDHVKRKVEAKKTTVHVATDRPVYRPGNEVSYRAIVRRAAGDLLTTPAGERVIVSVSDRAGNPLHRLDGRLSEFGTAAGSFRLPADIPPGRYAIAVRYRDESFHNGVFLVEAYRKPQVFIEIRADRPVFVRGEEVGFELRARYSFGRPLPGMALTVRVSERSTWDRLHDETHTTDANGRIRIVLPTTPGRDTTLSVRAEGRDLTGRSYVAVADIPLAGTAFRASLSIARDVLVVGESARLTLRTTDILGHPVAAKGVLEVGHAPLKGDDPAYSTVATLPVEIEGRAGLTHRVQKPGRYRFLYRGRDRTGREVTAAARLTVTEEEHRLLVRAEQSDYDVGDTASVTVSAPAAGRFALLTFEGEDLYGYRVVRLERESNVLSAPIEARHVPDVRIRVALAHAGKLWRGEDRIRVRQELRLKVSSDKLSYTPGDLCRLTLETTDAAGKGLPAEVALSVVDAGIYLLHPDQTSGLRATFRPPSRGDLVRTASSLDFRYEGRTVALSADLVAERERRKRGAKKTVMLAEHALVEDADEVIENESIGLGGGAGGARRGRGGRRNLRAGGGVPAGMREPSESFRVRSHFEDTAFFKADIVTSADGRATVEFRLPDDLTEWRLTARGASHGNAFGDSRAALVTEQPLVIRSALPRFLRDGDRLTAAAGILNGGAADVSVRVELATSAGTDPVEAGVEVPAGVERLVDWPLPAVEPGELQLSARAEAPGVGADGEQRSLSILPYGVAWRTGFAGVSTDAGERMLELPEDARSGTTRLRLHLTPTLTRAALEGLGELRAYPYGCTEQTVNRFYPALEIARAIRELGLDQEKALPELSAIARAGAIRLTYLQNGQGLWGWWKKGPTDPEMTAYALVALARAREAGIPFSEATLKKAGDALPALIQRTTDADLRAFLLLGRSRAFGADFGDLAAAFTDRKHLGLRGLAWLALAYEPLGADSQRAALVRRIEESLSDSTPADAETLGWTLAAVAGRDPACELSHRLCLALARLRKGRGFGTTRQTGAAVVGLARAAPALALPEEGVKVRVEINGERVTEERVDGRGRTLEIPAETLRPGRNRVAVTSSGGGTVFYSLSLRCVRREAPEGAGPLSLTRTFSLVPGAVDPWRGPRKSIVREGGKVFEPRVDRVRAGEAVRVTLRLRGARERHLVIEDPLPAGFEPVPGLARGGFLESARHDDKMVFFLEDPAEDLTLSYVVRGEAPGQVRAPPATAYAMYRPALAAYSAGHPLEVVGAEGPLDREPTLGYDAEGLWSRCRREIEAGNHAAARTFLEALLKRYELKKGPRAEVLRARAGICLALGDHEGVVGSYERLRTEDPTHAFDLADERLRARSFRALARHGEAVASMEHAADLLLREDLSALHALERDRFDLIVGLLDRHAFGAAVEREWIEFTRRDGEELEASAEFLARYPESDAAPRVALQVARAHLRSGDFVKLEAETRRFGDRYPGHHLADDAGWFLAYALFAQDRFDEAEAAARVGLERTFALADGGRGPSEYGNNLVHLLAQVAEIRGRLEEAVELYRRVRDVSVDAREALARLKRVELALPATTRIGLGESARIAVRTRNLAKVSIDLYPIDLLVYFALRKDVERVSGLSLDGLPPDRSHDVKVPAGRTRLPSSSTLDLEGLDAGVYLIVARAGDLERRSILIVSDIEAAIRAHEDGIRVRVTRRGTDEPVPGAFVKVAANDRIEGEGYTDARGVFEVPGEFHGPFAAVALKQKSYALTSD